MNRIETPYRPEVDGLRAVAVLSVILFHLGIETFSGGFVGVDVFFVISGYLITRLIVTETRNAHFSFSNFYIRRARRLFPALFFTLVVCFIAAAFLFSPQHLQRFGLSFVYSNIALSNFFFWSESGYFDTESQFKPLLHMWSLRLNKSGVYGSLF